MRGGATSDTRKDRQEVPKHHAGSVAELVQFLVREQLNGTCTSSSALVCGDVYRTLVWRNRRPHLIASACVHTRQLHATPTRREQGGGHQG